MTFHEIKVLDIVQNTISGAEGARLKDEVVSKLRINQGVMISFRGHGPLSTEFIRRSLGDLLLRFGHKLFLTHIRITGTHLGIEDLLCLGEQEVAA